MKIFDYSKASAKKAFKTINETEHIEDIAFHPSGSHLLVGVRHPVIRLYDVNTTQCFTGSIPRHQHLDVITSLDWASDGRLYASCSSDGAIKVTKDCRSIFFQLDNIQLSLLLFRFGTEYPAIAFKLTSKLMMAPRSPVSDFQETENIS